MVITKKTPREWSQKLSKNCPRLKGFKKKKKKSIICSHICHQGHSCNRAVGRSENLCGQSEFQGLLMKRFCLYCCQNLRLRLRSFQLHPWFRHPCLNLKKIIKLLILWQGWTTVLTFESLETL